MIKALRIDACDNVATLLADAAAGVAIDVGGEAVIAGADLPRGHKVALADIASGGAVMKFGYPIGRATRPIARGDHVHSDSLATGLAGAATYAYAPQAAAPMPAAADARFHGYRRADGRVGTRNEIWVLPTVGCVARTAQRIAEGAGADLAGIVDGVHAFAHPHGCSQLGLDLAGTRSILASLACHPNAGGVLIVGLGCEENQVAALLSEIPAWRRPAVATLVTQDTGDEVAEGIALVRRLAEAAPCDRTEASLADLVLGVKCGGSDGLSGLTANPTVGRISDRVAAAGGRVLLTEIPEIFGAEQLLMQRAADRDVFDAIGALVNGFKQHFLDHGETVSDNPSPGNVVGGITTLEEKSLGAVQKAGRAPVADVIGYGAQIRCDGLSLLEAPGNDAVSSTALAAAGATLILFTTGRGTPLGFPVPTLKIASNSDLARRKPGWIDFDAGAALEVGIDAAAEALLARIVAIASGEPTAAERNGEREIAIWKRGVTL